MIPQSLETPQLRCYYAKLCQNWQKKIEKSTLWNSIPDAWKQLKQHRKALKLIETSQLGF